MFLRSRECELESHQPPVATSRQRLRWRGGSGCDTDDWWCCTTVATGEKRHWRRRYRHRFDVGITIDVFRHSFDATFPPFWLCLVVWKDVVLQRRRLHRSRHTSGVICIVVKASYQAPFAVPFQVHFRRRSGTIPGVICNAILDTILVPFHMPLRKWHHWSATASHYLGIRIATFRRCSFWWTFRRTKEVLSASLAPFWRWFWQSKEMLWRPHCDAICSDVVQVSFANWNATKWRR